MAPAEESRFLNLPPEIRNMIYHRTLIAPTPLYLFQDKHSDIIQLFTPEQPRTNWLAILLTNHQLHTEAAAILYRHSRFVLINTAHDQARLVQSFLDRIGPTNANHLALLCINFPTLEPAAKAGSDSNSNKDDDDDNPDKLTISPNDIRCLTLLRERCAGLHTLDAAVHRSNGKALARASQDLGGSGAVGEALAQVDACLRGIPALRRVVVRFFNGPPTRGVTELMRRFGWEVVTGQ